MLSSDFSPLARLQTLNDCSFKQPPTLDMVRSMRLYACQDEDVPSKKLAPAAMRDLYKTVMERKAVVFISKENVFVTAKEVSTPQDMKKVAAEDVFPSFEMPMVRRALCDFILNEVLPVMSPCDATKLSLDFLVEFDRILNVPINNQHGVLMKTYNFRNLRHRLCTKLLTATEVAYVRNRLPKYTPLLDLFPDFVFTPV